MQLSHQLHTQSFKHKKYNKQTKLHFLLTSRPHVVICLNVSRALLMLRGDRDARCHHTSSENVSTQGLSGTDCSCDCLWWLPGCVWRIQSHPMEPKRWLEVGRWSTVRDQAATVVAGMTCYCLQLELGVGVECECHCVYGHFAEHLAEKSKYGPMPPCTGSQAAV